MSIPFQAMILNTTGEVVKYGYTDLTEDAVYDDSIHSISTVAEVLQLPAGQSYTKVFEGAFVEMTTAEKDAADVIHLAAIKSGKILEIDAKTVGLIAAGFTYNNKTFSLSDNAQKKVIAWKIKADNGDNASRTAATIDSMDTEVLADGAAVSAFYNAAFDEVQSHIDSGETLLASVRAATDKAGVDAVADNRS